mgnify:CR=1 FL=1
MGGESVQLSQAQKRRMEAMSMNMGTRIVCGYLASLLFLGISLYLAVTYHTSGDLQSFWCYLALAAICLTLDVLVTINLLRTMILGVGMNGHVALNEPGVDLTLGAHVATLANKTREVSSKYFENGTPVTLTRGLTLGYKNIFEAKDLVVILNGAHKAPIVKKFMETPISNEFPVTNIKRSPIARVVMDQAAASDIYRV